MADIAQLAIEVTSDSVPEATDKLQKLTEVAGEAETATGKLADETTGLGEQAAEAASGGLGGLTSMIGELAGPIGLAAGVALGKLAVSIFEVDDASAKAAATEAKRHQSFMQDLQNEINSLREKQRLITDPNGDSIKVQDKRTELENKLTDALRAQEEAQRAVAAAQEAATGTSRASYSQLASAKGQYEQATKAVSDLQVELGDLERQNAQVKYEQHTSEVKNFVAALQSQADQAGKNKVQILQMKEAQLQLTGADKEAADAALATLAANEKVTQAHKEQIPLKERLLDLLERQVASQGQITSSAAVMQLSNEKLTKDERARLDVLLNLSAATEAQVAAQKEADKVFEDGNRIAKERDDLENKLLMDREKYLESLRKAADPGFFGGQDYAKSVQGLNELYGRGLLSADQYDRAIVRVKDDYVRLAAQGDTTLQALVDLTDTAAQRMGQAFGDFVTTGKLDFRSLIDSILADFARLEAQKGIEQLFGYFLSFGASSIGGGASSGNLVEGGYGGGVDYSSGLGLAAGAAPALAAPSLPPAAGGAGLVANTTINVSSGPSGPQATVETSGAQQSAQLGEKLRGAVLQVLIEQQRPGGVLNHA